MINLRDFFNIYLDNTPVQEPINRISFSDEDVKYKAKCIKAMQDLGMIVTIDKIGNICGTIPGKLFTNKSIICGSHTDSVDNAGQFDGPLGVYIAIKAAEDIINSGKTNLVNYKAVIYASEESTRFEGKACLGSKYLRGDKIDFKNIISRDGLPLEEIVKNYKIKLFETLQQMECKPITEVDKVINSDEIVTALEGHIQQSDELLKHKNSIGICTSIVAPYRVKVDITDIETAANFICDLIESAKQTENSSKYRITIPEFSVKNNYTDSDLQNKKIITIRSHGENNHSGATPMKQRKDAVYGAAKFIQNLSQNPDIQFLETCTANWGTNQINNCCDIKFAVNSQASEKSILELWLNQKDAAKLANIYYEKIDNITQSDKETGLFIDVRQQIGMNTKLSSDMIFECMKDIVHTTNCNSYMHITAKGEPVKTNLDLVESATQICQDKKINYEILESWAGHDLATLTNNENARILLLFCDNSGGSHNPNETTTIDSINKLTEVESTLAQQELQRANELYLQASYNSLNQKKSELSNSFIGKRKLKIIDKKLTQIRKLSKESNISLDNQHDTEKE